MFDVVLGEMFNYNDQANDEDGRVMTVGQHKMHLLTLDVVLGEAFASSRRFTICEWPCWAACKYRICTMCVKTIFFNIQYSANENDEVDFDQTRTPTPLIQH